MSGGSGGGRRWLARGGAQWWRRKSNCCMAAEEKQRHGGWSGGRRQVGRRRAGCSFFFWMNTTSILPSTILPKKGGNFLFWGEVFATIWGRIRIGVILWSFLVILPPILPWILPQSYLKRCWDYGPKILNKFTLPTILNMADKGKHPATLQPLANRILTWRNRRLPSPTMINLFLCLWFCPWVRAKRGI